MGYSARITRFWSHIFGKKAKVFLFLLAYSGNVHVTLRKKTFCRFYFLSAVENNAITSVSSQKSKKVNENSEKIILKSKKLKLALKIL